MNVRLHEMNWQTAVNILSALLTPLIAIIATYIAWQQWRANELKLRIDRYEKRLRIYQEVVRMLSAIARDKEAKIEDLMTFRANTVEADFLFGPEISKYIDEIFSRGYEAFIVKTSYSHGYAPDTRAERSQVEITWLSEQFNPAKEKFAKYLNVNR